MTPYFRNTRSMNTLPRFLFAMSACLLIGVVYAQEPAAPKPPADPAAQTPPAAQAAAPSEQAEAPASGAAPADAQAAQSTEGPADANGTRALDQQIQDLKKDVVDLNKDLFVLEEELLFPANTQVAVFVSVDVGDFFALDSISLKVDNHDVSNYLYTPRETAALIKGGVQRLFVGNLKSGQHELDAFFSGKGPNDRDYKRGATIRFQKGIGAKYLELKI